MDTRCAEAQSSEAAVFPPQVILWGIQRGCDTDAASERRLIERLESYAGPPVRRMTVPSDPRLLNCVGVQCAQLVQDACPQLTGQLVGGEVDEAISFAGPTPELVVRLRVWRYDLGNKKDYYSYGLCPRGVCGHLTVQDKLADMASHLVERQPFEADLRPIQEVLDSRLPLCAMPPERLLLPTWALDFKAQRATFEPCRPFPLPRCSGTTLSQMHKNAPTFGRSGNASGLSRSVINGTEGAVWGLFGTSAVSAVMLFALNGSSLATSQGANYDVHGTLFRPALTATVFSLATLAVAIPTTYFLERDAEKFPQPSSASEAQLLCPR